MTVVNGMEIQPELVEFLRSKCFNNCDNTSTMFDADAEYLSELNDFFIDLLSSALHDDIAEIEQISYHLVAIKSLKDDMKQLSKLMKQCKIERDFNHE